MKDSDSATAIAVSHASSSQPLETPMAATINPNSLKFVS
jgi:hypothetical protein